MTTVRFREAAFFVAGGAVLGLLATEVIARTTLTLPILAAVGVAVLSAALLRPLWACALFLASTSIGNRDLPLAPFGLQVVHFLCGLAIFSVLVGLARGHLQWPRAPGPEVRRVLVAVTGFVVIVLASAVASTAPERSVKTAITLAAALAILGCLILTVQSTSDLLILVSAFVLGSLPLSIRGLIEGSQAQAVYAGAVVRGRPSGDFSEPNALGLFCAIVSLTSLGLWLWSTMWQPRLIGLIGGLAGVAALGALAASLSRGAWMGVVAGTATFIVLYRPVVKPLVKGAIIAVSVAVPLTLLGAVSGLPQLVVERAGTIISGEENPYDVRPLTWGEAVRQTALRPLIGNGPGVFPELSSQWPSVIQFYPRVHAHNGMLTTAAETGLLGLAFALAVVVLVTLAVVNVPHRDALRVALFSGLVAVGTHLLVDYPLRNPVLMLSVWSVLGLLLASLRIAGTHGGFTLQSAVAQPPRPKLAETSI